MAIRLLIGNGGPRWLGRRAGWGFVEGSVGLRWGSGRSPERVFARYGRNSAAR